MKSPKRKIAVLGGGMSALTSVYQLAETGEYDITVYQMGWRLGGKGASGRNQEKNDRIEEHGLHVWFGFYENAFRLMREVYTKLGRPEGAPLANVEQAFKPVDELTMIEEWEGVRKDWKIVFPINEMKPGEGGELFSIWSSLNILLQWLVLFAKGNIDATLHSEKDHPKNRHHLIDIPEWMQDILHEGEKEVEKLIVTEVWVLEKILKYFRGLESHKQPSKHHHKILTWLARKALTIVWNRVEDKIDTDDHSRRYWMLVNLATTTFIGLINDNVLEEGFDPLDQLDFAEWFFAHKLVDSDRANDIAFNPEYSAPIRTIYDLFFHYADGDTTKPSIAAGVTLLSILRILAGYKGSVLWYMQAGMGDTIFAPMYELLKQKGVSFKFFHRVTNIGLGSEANAHTVENVTISKQVNLKVDEYNPLYPVKDLPCWPSNPFYDQIVEGEELKNRKINLERSPKYSKWKDTGGTITLKAGVDFDDVILGITLSVLPNITKELMVASNAWNQMCNGIKTVQTQAIQLWFNKDSEELGLPETDISKLENHEMNRFRPVVGAYYEPYASETNFSHLLERENWGDNPIAKHLAYSCGVMKLLPNETQPGADERAKNVALDLLNNHADHLWPNATDPDNPKGLDWNTVVAPEGVVGDKRFDAQYIRANIDTNEKYVQSLPKTNQFRIKTDGTGFKNLIITGTWIDLGYNIACIEAAAIAGMQAARVLTGVPKHIYGETPFLEDV